MGINSCPYILFHYTVKNKVTLWTKEHESSATVPSHLHFTLYCAWTMHVYLHFLYQVIPASS
jgi:hypothetical protein